MKKIYTFKEFVEAENPYQHLDEGGPLFRLIKGGIGRLVRYFGDDAVSTASRFVRGADQSVDDWISGLQQQIREIIPGQIGDGGITRVLFGYWRTFRTFLQNPTPENWQQVMKLMKFENFQVSVGDNGQLIFNMEGRIQNMGDAAETPIVDEFFNAILEMLNGMDIDWNDFV